MLRRRVPSTRAFIPSMLAATRSVADLFDANRATLWSANLTGANFDLQAGSLPNIASVAEAEGLSTMRFLTRRMSALAAQLVEHVIPHVPVRQWARSLPWSLRYQLAFDAALCRDVLRGVHARGVRLARDQRRPPGPPPAPVWGGHGDLNLHLHSLVLDGVYTRSSPGRGACLSSSTPAH